MPHTGPAATQPKLKSLVHSDVLGRLNWHNPAMPFIYTFETQRASVKQQCVSTVTGTVIGFRTSSK